MSIWISPFALWQARTIIYGSLTALCAYVMNRIFDN